MTTEIKYELGNHPSLPPPTSEVGAIGWLRKNLFSNVTNSILTLLALYIVFVMIPPVLKWAIIDSDLAGSTRDACDSGGACWVFIKERLPQFIYGFYPEELRWRINLLFVLFVVTLIPLTLENTKRKGIWALLFLVVLPVVGFFLLHGDSFGLERVESSKFGGLSLTLVISAVGIVAAFPLAILLALGRMSDMPVIKSLCVIFIEVIRGVPLITILFMSSVMLPLFLPEGTNFDKLVRALIGITLFSAAYLAEVVRGGLQAIPKGQYEGAKALGLSYWKSMIFIILPQALKHVIPGIVGSFIALLKDTTLVLIISLYDFLGIIQASLTDVKWLGLHLEAYFFAGVCYWAMCYSMSLYSRSIEERLNTGHKR